MTLQPCQRLFNEIHCCGEVKQHTFCSERRKVLSPRPLIVRVHPTHRAIVDVLSNCLVADSMPGFASVQDFVSASLACVETWADIILTGDKSREEGRS